jgi:sulfur relay (sulfurtransferase) complex TusBCD TusD component (DsrE family)
LARIAFVIHSSPRSDIGTRSFYHLASAAVNLGHQVIGYCHQDGVYQLIRAQHGLENELSHSGCWQALMVRGAVVYCSELCARGRGVYSKDLLLEGVRFSHATDLAVLLKGCDQVVCL